MAFDLSFLGFEPPSETRQPIHVAVPSGRQRIRTRGVRCSAYAALPDNAYVQVGHGVALACPELVFVELGAVMQPAVQLLAGLELCGGFSRNPVLPRDGDVTYGIAPATTPEHVGAFLAECRHVPGIDQSRRICERLCADAWSPTEALIAAMASLGPEDYGYDLGPVILNRRVVTQGGQTRVPDILLCGSHVGINYDGAVHLGLEDVAAAAGTDRLGAVMERVRGKAVDDRRRDRELIAAGYSVLPVTREDLYQPGRLDAVMDQVMMLVSRELGRSFAKHRAFLARPRIREERQRLVWWLLPGGRGAALLREAARDDLAQREPLRIEEHSITL